MIILRYASLKGKNMLFLAWEMKNCKKKKKTTCVHEVNDGAIYSILMRINKCEHLARHATQKAEEASLQFCPH